MIETKPRLKIQDLVLPQEPRKVIVRMFDPEEELSGYDITAGAPHINDIIDGFEKGRGFEENNARFNLEQLVYVATLFPNQLSHITPGFWKSVNKNIVNKRNLPQSTLQATRLSQLLDGSGNVDSISEKTWKNVKNVFDGEDHKGQFRIAAVVKRVSSMHANKFQPSNFNWSEAFKDLDTYESKSRWEFYVDLRTNLSIVDQNRLETLGKPVPWNHLKEFFTLHKNRSSDGLMRLATLLTHLSSVEEKKVLKVERLAPDVPKLRKF